MELVSRYASRKCEDSFATLVSRHINMVYSVALRQVGNAQQAEEITQAVFLTLAHKASRLPRGTVLSGWLFQTTRLTAANSQRSEFRRIRREHEAYMQSNLDQSGEDVWREIKPLFNDAIAELGRKDRDAVVLRFIEGKNLKEVGATLGLSEEAAKKRVSRAVEKLRIFFSTHGTEFSSDSLASVIEAKSVQAAPTALAGAILAQALHPTVVTSTTLLLMKSTMKLMAWAKLKTALITGSALLLAAGTITLITAAASNDQKPPAKQAVATPKSTTAKALVFRNQPSWNRNPDFEDVLADERLPFDVMPSAEMAATDFRAYGFVIIPGSQDRDFYRDYAANEPRFDTYVRNGGTLILELNNAENSGITLPGGGSIMKHPATDNLITVPDHPALASFSGKKIHANFASHCYLQGFPTNALILVVEIEGDQPAFDRPTYIEYPHGKGRVLAACQCFHDRDASHRGVLMPAVLTYAADKQWYTPAKAPKP